MQTFTCYFMFNLRGKLVNLMETKIHKEVEPNQMSRKPFN